MKMHHGFVLLLVLIFMQVYALLGLTALGQVFLGEKILTDQKARRDLLNEAQSMMRRIAISFDSNRSSCLIPVATANQLRTHPLAWWTAHACADAGSFYVIEALGEDPCAQPATENQTIAAYFRVTLLLINQQDPKTQIMLQSTVIKGSPSLEHCDNERHSVDCGLQSWFEL